MMMHMLCWINVTLYFHVREHMNFWDLIIPLALTPVGGKQTLAVGFSVSKPKKIFASQTGANLTVLGEIREWISQHQTGSYTQRSVWSSGSLFFLVPCDEEAYMLLPVIFVFWNSSFRWKCLRVISYLYCILGLHI